MLKIIIAAVIAIITGVTINLWCVIHAIMELAHKFDAHTLTGTDVAIAIVMILLREFFAVIGALASGALTYLLLSAFKVRK